VQSMRWPQSVLTVIVESSVTEWKLTGKSSAALIVRVLPGKRS